MKKYLIKFAWRCNHEYFGDITSFVVSPYQETSPNSFGYILDNSADEVIRFKSNHPMVGNILPKLAPYGRNQWSMPSYGDLVEFDMDEFNYNEIYQENYNRDVAFHTHYLCE